MGVGAASHADGDFHDVARHAPHHGVVRMGDEVAFDRVVSSGHRNTMVFSCSAIGDEMARRKRRRWRWLVPADRELVLARVRAGERIADVAAAFDVGVMTVYRIRDDAALSSRRVSHSGFRLSFQERVEIAMRVAAGESDSEIARGLGRHRSTIGRELGRCGGRERYRAIRAEQRAQWTARRPKETKLARCPGLLAEVERGLLEFWSPEQISARLRREHPEDRELRISHETIYRSLYVHSRGELRRQLTAQLRTGRSKRREQGRIETRGRIREMIPISQRPAEIEDRAVPGHWEGDLIMGAGGRSAVATLVERQTRYVMLAHIGTDRSTQHVIEALKHQVRTLPADLVRSLTWDQGRELAAHQQFTVDTGVQVFFCDPHSPWQRGSNENTNGLLRQFLPKGSDLAVHDQAELDRIAALLNGRPRQTLDWANPAEKMLELLETVR
jgi:transposase, IS30 family